MTMARPGAGAAKTLMLCAVLACPRAFARPERVMERLGRGVVAVNLGGGRVFVSWRTLGTDPDDVAFDLYRRTGGGAPARLNERPIAGATCFVDTGADTRRGLA
ncbi:MAG: rhamnogalacturonan endolyase family protein, partial [Planctomycetota bacterium]